MKTPVTALVLMTLPVLLAACGKVTQTATEKMAEKAIEAQMTKDGGKADVNISGGVAKVTTTDAEGKSTTMELGGAQVSEAELGIPFYPGAQLAKGGSSRMVAPDGTLFTVRQHSGDPADKVAAFYREKLKPLSADKQFNDLNLGNGNITLMLIDDKTNSSIQVHVAKAETGSDIQIVSSRGKGK